MIVFRKLQHSDLDVVDVINQASFSAPWGKGTMIMELNNPVTCYLAMELDGVVIAYAGAWVILDEAHVTNVAVAPEFRRRGYGAQLVAALKKYCYERGARRMTLEVRRSNVAALRVYEAQGFYQDGVRKGYYSDNGEDALILWNELERGMEDEGTTGTADTGLGNQL